MRKMKRFGVTLNEHEVISTRGAQLWTVKRTGCVEISNPKISPFALKEANVRLSTYSQHWVQNHPYWGPETPKMRGKITVLLVAHSFILAAH